MSRQTGAQNPNWRGGRVTEPRGYVLIRVGKGHPLADVRGYAYEHRITAVAAGLDVAGKHVHHDDEAKGHNALGNLEALTPAEHRRRHRKFERGQRNPGEPNPEIGCACGCGEGLLKFDSSGRPRTWISGHNPHPAPTVAAILAALKGGSTRIAEIASSAGLSKSVTKTTLSKMKRSGVAHQRAHGVWSSYAAEVDHGN